MSAKSEFVFQFRFTYEFPYRLGITVEESNYDRARELAVRRFEFLMPHVPVDSCEIHWF